MFGILNDVVKVVDSSLSILDGLIEGELPTQSQLTKLVGSGVSLYMVSEETGIAVEALRAILDE
jgi:hypothetical protein